MRTLRRGLVEFHRVGGNLAGIALGCMLFVPALISVSAGWSFWVGLLIGFVLVIILLLIYGLGSEER